MNVHTKKACLIIQTKQFIKLLSEKTPNYQKCHTLTLLRVTLFYCVFCVYLDLLNICLYNMTEIRFIVMINSKKATQNVCVCDILKFQCVTQKQPKKTLCLDFIVIFY